VVVVGAKILSVKAGKVALIELLIFARLYVIVWFKSETYTRSLLTKFVIGIKNPKLSVSQAFVQNFPS